MTAGGIFLGGWSYSTALVLYWWENFFGSLLIAIRIVLHRRLTRKRGHYPRRITFQSDQNGVPAPAGRGGFLADFLGSRRVTIGSVFVS
ncbi:MAG: hypothetical protein HYX76_06825 [Acidobacteria bacterium]|nr:hypothetical protein [Acidobacteriota bacterium]